MVLHKSCSKHHHLLLTNIKKEKELVINNRYCFGFDGSNALTAIPHLPVLACFFTISTSTDLIPVCSFSVISFPTDNENDPTTECDVVLNLPSRVLSFRIFLNCSLSIMSKPVTWYTPASSG